jgi:hypothetical protein
MIAGRRRRNRRTDWAIDPDVQDVKPILDRNCLSCHGSRGASGNYSVATYADVLNGQTRGDAKSPLIVTGWPGGSMHR